MQVYGLEKNYLRTVNSDLYFPNEVEDVNVPRLSDGELDAVAALFSNENIEQHNNEFDQFGVLVGVDKIFGSYRDATGYFEVIVKTK